MKRKPPNVPVGGGTARIDPGDVGQLPLTRHKGRKEMEHFFGSLFTVWIPLLCFSILPKVPRGEKGQGLVEYSLIILLVSIVVIGTLAALGTEVNTTLSTVTSTMATGTP